MRPKSTTVEEILARLAGKAHGVVTREELLRAGVTKAELRQRVRIGALIRIHRGVFRVGHASPSQVASYLAAVKACGEHALLARRAAAHLFGLLKRPPARAEVITPNKRHVPGIVTRRCRDAVQDGIRWRGIPVTTVPRTLVDLAAVLNEEELARAFHEAAVRHGTTPDHVETVLGRRQNWPGAGNLRRVLWGDEPVTLSRLETLFLRRLREAALPLPEVNQVVDGLYVDCRWPQHRLTVELDGYRYHHTRHAWEQDHRRERAARTRGDEFRRYTWGDAAEQPAPMLAELTSLLGRGRLVSQGDT
jgi:very-short-patch-repair endonuclease